MNSFGKPLLIFLFLAAIMLASCNSSQARPTMSDAEIMETAMTTVSTVFAETQRGMPTATANAPTELVPAALLTLTARPTATDTLSATSTPTLVPGPTGTPIFPPIESFVGIWHSSNPWPKIVIASDGGTLFANIRYACERPEYWTFPKDCELGVTSAAYSGNPVLMVIESGSETYNFTLSLNGDTLHVTTFIDYTDNSGIADETHEQKFSKEVYSLPVFEQIGFYHFFLPQRPNPWAVRTPILLLSASSDKPYTSDTAADLRTALELVLHHDRNDWISSDLEIVDVTFRNGHADIVLQGEYSGESDEVLVAARMQILLTVFANPAVQSAAVTLNGDTIGNLGVSSRTNAKPADYVYTRAEIETYWIEHYYSLEYGEFLDR